MVILKKRAVLILLSLLSLRLTTSLAEDLTELKNCISENYQSLPNRNGIVTSVLNQYSSEIMTFGNAKPDQLFEIGSVTKTFTANLLAQAVLSQSLKITDPIPSDYQKQGYTITFQNLTTHTSGIDDSEILKNFKSTNPLFAFDGLSVSIFKDLYAKIQLITPPGSTWQYSNMAVSLMGLILSEKANTPYEAMVQNTILSPLGMKDTYFHVPDSESSRFPAGFLMAADGTHVPAPHWDLSTTALDPAGGIRSSISDMTIYARANLIPDSTVLKAPITLAQQPLYSINKDQSMGMNWFIEQGSGVRWHHGVTMGFNSILAISSARHQAVVAMTDTVVVKKDSSGNMVPDTAFQEVAVNCLK